MNWTWNIRSNDGAMNGLEFARCTTAGGFSRALIHAAPSKAKIEIIDGDDHLVARADLERSGEYSPMTLVEIDGRALRRSEVWPTEDFYGLPVLLAGGEVGILQAWQHAEDHSWWRWSVEFSNHTGRPDDWAPAGQYLRRGPGQPELCLLTMRFAKKQDDIQGRTEIDVIALDGGSRACSPQPGW